MTEEERFEALQAEFVRRDEQRRHDEERRRREFREKMRDPVFAQAFLVSTGIYEVGPGGDLQLTERYGGPSSCTSN